MKEILVIFKLILLIDGWSIHCEIVLRWLSQDLNYDKSTLVQVMDWCRQAASHYLSHVDPDLCLHMVSLNYNEFPPISFTTENEHHREKRITHHGDIKTLVPSASTFDFITEIYITEPTKSYTTEITKSFLHCTHFCWLPEQIMYDRWQNLASSWLENLAYISTNLTWQNNMPQKTTKSHITEKPYIKSWFHAHSSPLASWLNTVVPADIQNNVWVTVNSLHEKLSWPRVQSDKWLTKPTSPKLSLLVQYNFWLATSTSPHK